MNRRGVTAKNLAKITGLSEGCISNYANGEYEPGIRKMRQIAAALICGVSEIWPHIHEPIDWEFRHQLLTERIEKLDYRKNYEEYKALCNERNWVSIKIYVNEQRTRLKNYHTDDYCQGETYGRIPSTGKVVLI